MKLNKKGFTLVELIVVMAIIAVLAAILVPTMLGFMNNAKFTQANANAKTVYTAVNSVVADYCTDHAALTAATEIDIAAGSTMPITLGSDSVEMKDFLDGMTGNSKSVLNSTGTGVSFTTWTLGTPTAVQVTKADQKAKTGTAVDDANNIIGCYPLA